jgi:ABC-2 type transport system permease protein
MGAIIKRELYAYFTSAIGFVYLGSVYFLSGALLRALSLINNSADLRPVFSSLLLVVMFLSPVLTMRLMSEDRRRRTDQALLTAPVTLGAIVAGKFLAAAIVFTAGLSVTLAQAFCLNFLAAINWAIVWGSFTALLLLGFAFIAIGQFISSLTENQAIAAIGSFAVMFGILLLDALPSIIPNPQLSALIAGLSFTRHYTPIMNGILSLSGLFFFISVCGIFMFLTTRVMEKRRWS